MSRRGTLAGGVATSVIGDMSNGAVSYHGTVVVLWDRERITLNSGGWLTATTKKRMNQASNEYDLGFSVYQSKHQWYVTTVDGRKFEFHDGITFNRR